jgi:hypothetical protein
MTALNAVFLDKENWVDRLGHKYEETIQNPGTGEFFTNETRDAMLKKNPTLPGTFVMLKLKGLLLFDDDSIDLHHFLTRSTFNRIR